MSSVPQGGIDWSYKPDWGYEPDDDYDYWEDDEWDGRYEVPEEDSQEVDFKFGKTIPEHLKESGI